jgi:hypothetical protein
VLIVRLLQDIKALLREQAPPGGWNKHLAKVSPCQQLT